MSSRRSTRRPSPPPASWTFPRDSCPSRPWSSRTLSLSPLLHLYSILVVCIYQTSDEARHDCVLVHLILVGYLSCFVHNNFRYSSFGLALTEPWIKRMTLISFSQLRKINYSFILRAL